MRDAQVFYYSQSSQKNMAIIGINASFLRKQNTGIGQVSINFLKKLIEVESQKSKVHKENMEFVLYLEEDIDPKLLEEIGSAATMFKKNIFLPAYKRDDLIRKIWWENFSLPKRIKEDECDIFLSMYQSATVLCGKRRAKHIMIVHDVIPRLFPEYLNNWRKKIYQKFIERAINKADKIVAVSHRTEKDLVQHLNIDPKKITVSYVDVDEIYKKEVTQEESQRVLKKYKLKPGYIYSGGGLEVRKNTESFLRAYKILLEAYGHASWLPKVVISGKMMPELAPLVCDIAAVVEGLELQKEVSLLGFVSQEDLPALYKNSCLFVYPSFYEGFGLPILEAMNQGAPVITARTSSLPEVGSDSVLYCKPGDVDDLALVIKSVLTKEHLQAALSMKGKARAEHFSWENFVGKIMHIISEIK